MLSRIRKDLFECERKEKYISTDINFFSMRPNEKGDGFYKMVLDEGGD